MLTADLVRPRLREQDGRLQINHLSVDQPHWQRTAADLIHLFQKHLNRSQGEWQTALDDYTGDRTDYEVIRGLAKVLSDAADFEHLETPIASAVLRQHLFAHGPLLAQADLFMPMTRGDLIAQAAAEFELSVEQIEAILYADHPEAYRLMDAGPDWTPVALIQRYNLELARAALYWADQMQVEIYDHFKSLYLKKRYDRNKIVSKKVMSETVQVPKHKACPEDQFLITPVCARGRTVSEAARRS